MSNTAADRQKVNQTRVIGKIPPTLLVILSGTSTQVGAGVAKQLFPYIGTESVVFLRIGFAALLLNSIWRPKLRNVGASAWFSVIGLGVALAAMNSTFYVALNRIPLGITVTIEFTGPLLVAILGSRRWTDVIWTMMAAGGILLFAPWAGSSLDVVGIFFALLAGVFWAMYIIFSSRVGRVFPEGSGLAASMAVAAILTAPAGIYAGGAKLLNPSILLMGAGVALFSSALPYTLEIEALRRLPTQAFGILMSLEPAIAAIIGFLLLKETLSLKDIAAIALVSCATAGTSILRRRSAVPADAAAI